MGIHRVLASQEDFLLLSAFKNCTTVEINGRTVSHFQGVVRTKRGNPRQIWIMTAS